MVGQHDARERLRGITLLLLSVSLFAAVDGVSKLLAETQSVGQIVWARYALALPVLLATHRPTEWANLFRSDKPRLQIVRAIAPLFVGGSMVMAVRYLPLAEATVILFAAPFLVVALSGPFLGERVPVASWVGVVVGFAAVVVVARPGISELSKFAIFPLAGAVFYALFQLLTGRLAAAGETADTTLAWTLGAGVAVTTPIAVFTWAPVSETAWLLMIVLGLSFGLAQALLVRAFSHAPASLLAPFSYGQIIAATVFGMVVFGAVPDLWTWVGIAMIIGAGVYVTQSRAA